MSCEAGLGGDCEGVVSRSERRVVPAEELPLLSPPVLLS